MQIHIHIHDHRGHIEEKLDEAIRLIISNNLKLNKLMTKEEFAQAFEDANVILQKGFAEVVAAAQASGNSTPRMDAALTAFQAAAKTLDELNPDAPAPTPEP